MDNERILLRAEHENMKQRWKHTKETSFIETTDIHWDSRLSFVPLEHMSAKN